MSSIKLREYQSGDFEGILALWKQTDLGDEKRGDDELGIEKSLSCKGKFWILEVDSPHRIIGTCWVSNDSRRLYLHHLGIIPDQQNRGYGKLLCKTALEYAKSLNMQIKLEVHQNNFAALKIYKEFGFEYLGDYQVFIKRKH